MDMCGFTTVPELVSHTAYLVRVGDARRLKEIADEMARQYAALYFEHESWKDDPDYLEWVAKQEEMHPPRGL